MNVETFQTFYEDEFETETAKNHNRVRRSVSHAIRGPTTITSAHRHYPHIEQIARAHPAFRIANEQRAEHLCPVMGLSEAEVARCSASPG